MTRRYRVEHRTTYTYSDEVTSSYGRCYLTPRELPNQRIDAHEVAVEPTPSDISTSVDVDGNESVFFHITDEHTALVVTARSDVRVDPPTPLPIDQRWEDVRPGALAVEFALDLTPSEITPEVAAYAALSFTPDRALGAVIIELTERIYTDFTYRSGSTTVSSSVASVLAAREGVCQDFARLAIACLRSKGLAARYVSGYLATDPPPGKERMVGVDATHAWAAVWVAPDTWLAFDPTNNQLVDERYITVAWGRDYADVPPLRGIIYTDATESTIDVSVDVRPF